jgi:hypothetical protein
MRLLERLGLSECRFCRRVEASAQIQSDDAVDAHETEVRRNIEPGGGESFV